MPIGVTASIGRGLRSQRGAVAIQLALTMTVLLGMIGLGTEVTFLLYKQRQMQAAADAAALGGATALTRGYPSDYRIEARAIAAEAGFVDGVDQTSVSVLRPPTIGSFAGNNSAVEVIVSQPQTLSLVSLLGPAEYSVGAYAVATVGGSGTACVLQVLNSSMTGISMSNGASVNLVQCGMNVDALGASALSVTGAAVLNTQFASVSGNTRVSNGGVINATDGVKINQASVADPYASVSQPSYSGCNYNNKSLGHSGSRQYISPGVYCNGLAFTNDAIVTMNPGVYIIDRGTFDVGGSVQLTGTGVTVFLTRSTGSTYAKVNIGNGAQVAMTAPTNGNTAGIVFFGDRSAPSGTTQGFGGGATLNLTGSIYFPSQTVNFTNGVSNPSGCTQLIAGKIVFTGAAQFKANCTNTGVISVGGATIALVE